MNWLPTIRLSRHGLWVEVPNSWPGWLHTRVCTFCRLLLAYVREQERSLPDPTRDVRHTPQDHAAPASNCAPLSQQTEPTGRNQ